MDRRGGLDDSHQTTSVMRGASRAGQEEGKPGFPSSLFFQGQAGEGVGSVPTGHEGHRQYRMPVCWAAGWPYGAATASSETGRGAVE